MTGPQTRPSGDGARLGATSQRTVRLPHGRLAVPRAREQVVADLTARGLSRPVVEEAESVAAELVSNAVRHASALADGTVRLHWQVREGVVEVEVTDGGGQTRPQPLPPSTWSASGRGLRIVRSLAHEWGVLESTSGRTVWASVGGPSRRRAH
jgi:anti-sigma regulatory factor (Ser/Thr protein kinase)